MKCGDVAWRKISCKMHKMSQISFFNPKPDRSLYEIHVFDTKSRDLTKIHVFEVKYSFMTPFFAKIDCKQMRYGAFA